MPLLLTLILGVFLLVGAGIAASARDGSLVEHLSVAIALGSMAGLVVADLIPEAMESLTGGYAILIPVFAVLGIMTLKILDRFIPEHDDHHGLEHDCTPENTTHIGIISTLAVTIHNMIEGMTVFTIASHDLSMGLMISLGVGLHNIPLGMMIYSTIRHEKSGKRRMLIAIAALSTFLGGVVMNLFWQGISEMILGVLISLTIGLMLYIIVFELLPHVLHGKRKGLSLLGVILGLGLICVAELLG